MTRTVETFGAEMIQSAKNAVMAKGGAMRSMVAFALVHSKFRNRSRGTSLETAFGMIEDACKGVLTEGTLKKYFSEAKAVLDYGLVGNQTLKLTTLNATDEAAAIDEAMLYVDSINISAAVKARADDLAAKKAAKNPTPQNQDAGSDTPVSEIPLTPLEAAMAKAAADMAAKAEAAKLALELEMAAKVAVMNLAKGGAERDAMVRIADLIQSILSATDAVNTPEAVAA
jgi:hypothetical protein